MAAHLSERRLDKVTEKSQSEKGPFTIVARVIRQEGHCAADHRVGDEVIFDGQTVQGKVFAMRYGAEFPWLEDQAVATHACPDAWNPVVFEIRRVGDE
jgi:uncharacterized repeat protein (TIGR04076 family)